VACSVTVGIAWIAGSTGVSLAAVVILFITASRLFNIVRGLDESDGDDQGDAD
jgi:hypothetical protein